MRHKARVQGRAAWPTPVPTRDRRRRHPVRRFLLLTVGLVAIFVIGRTYVLSVYAPGLQAEARAVPSLVRGQLGRHGAAYVPLSGITPSLRHAIIAVEDRRFFQHPGVDPIGVLRAAWVNLTNQRIDQGGSTLEEQLAKRAIVHDEGSLHAKLRTMALAWAIDQEFSKRRILELYLNAAYYGRGAYGAEAAARTYFGVSAAQLTVPQAAFLAALPQAPSIYGASPRSPQVVARQRTVLRDMLRLGYLTRAEERAAENAQILFAFVT